MSSQYQGKLWDRYQCYVAAMKAMNKPYKSFDEWLAS
jgi:hypothetical protein